MPRHEAFWQCPRLAGSEPGAQLCRSCWAQAAKTHGSPVPLGFGCCVICCPCPYCPSIHVPTQGGGLGVHPGGAGGLQSRLGGCLQQFAQHGVAVVGLESPQAVAWPCPHGGRVPDVSQGAGLRPQEEAQSSVGGTQLTLSPPQCVLQAQNQELEELNKELRQCNLQQFIQQTGATVTVGQARSEEDAQPEPSPRELPACRRNGGQRAGSATGGCPVTPNVSLMAPAPSSSSSSPWAPCGSAPRDLRPCFHGMALGTGRCGDGGQAGSLVLGMGERPRGAARPCVEWGTGEHGDLVPSPEGYPLSVSPGCPASSA